MAQDKATQDAQAQAQEQATDTNTTDTNKISLLITEEQKKILEEQTDQNTEKAKITIRLTDTNKSMTLTKKAQDLFKAQGLKINKNGYYNYNKNKALYDTVYAIAQANADLFYIDAQ